MINFVIFIIHFLLPFIKNNNILDKIQFILNNNILDKIQFILLGEFSK